MELVQPFLSRHVRARFEDGSVPTGPSMDTVDFAVVGILDISGYSKLTSMLSSRGTIGAELLTRLLNPYFEAMIRVVEQYGGDIIKFAGDAIIVCWRPLVEDLRESVETARFMAAMRACTASLELLKQLGDYPLTIPETNAKARRRRSTSGARQDGQSTDAQSPVGKRSRTTRKGSHTGATIGLRGHNSVVVRALKSSESILNEDTSEGSRTVTLSMHIGIACGKSYDVHVGLPGRRWEYFVAGEAIRGVAPILDEAKRGELAVTAETLRIIEADAGGLGVETGLGERTADFAILKSLKFKVPIQLTLDNLGNQMIPNNTHKLYINESALHRLLNGEGEFMNELRFVTVLFMKIGAVGDGTPEFLETAQYAMGVTLKALHEFDGTLRQMMMDDKGLTILCVFGLPPWSHQNETIFAMKAALKIHGRFKRRLPSFAIGVGTGYVYTGTVGSSARCDHTILGDCVNMAARLMSHSLAKKNILCDELTYTHARDAFAFNKPDPIMVKGKSHPINVYLPQTNSEKDISSMMSGDTTVVSDNTIVGRDADLALVRETVAVVSKGESRTLVVGGEVGQGKSTIARFTANTAKNSNYIVCTANATEAEKKTPLYAMRGIMLNLFDAVNDASFEYKPNPQFIKSTAPPPATGPDTTASSPAGPSAAGTEGPKGHQGTLLRRGPVTSGAPGDSTISVAKSRAEPQLLRKQGQQSVPPPMPIGGRTAAMSHDRRGSIAPSQETGHPALFRMGTSFAAYGRRATLTQANILSAANAALARVEASPASGAAPAGGESAVFEKPQLRRTTTTQLINHATSTASASRDEVIVALKGKDGMTAIAATPAPTAVAPPPEGTQRSAEARAGELWGRARILSQQVTRLNMAQLATALPEAVPTPTSATPTVQRVSPRSTSAPKLADAPNPGMERTPLSIASQMIQQREPSGGQLVPSPASPISPTSSRGTIANDLSSFAASAASAARTSPTSTSTTLPQMAPEIAAAAAAPSPETVRRSKRSRRTPHPPAEVVARLSEEVSEERKAEVARQVRLEKQAKQAERAAKLERLAQEKKNKEAEKEQQQQQSDPAPTKVAPLVRIHSSVPLIEDVQLEQAPEETSHGLIRTDSQDSLDSVESAEGKSTHESALASARAAAIERITQALKKLEENVTAEQVLGKVFPDLFGDRQATVEVLRTFFARVLAKVAAVRPVLLVVDDAHWVDAVTWTFLSYAIENAPFRVLVCVLSRPVATFEDRVAASKYEQFIRTGKVVQIALGGLSVNDTARVVAMYAGCKTVNQALATAICEKTHGRIAFIQNLTQALKNLGLTDVVSGELRFRHVNVNLASLGDLIPDDVESSIIVQYDKLDHDFQAVLRVAAVMGQYFFVPALLAVMELTQESSSATHNLLRRNTNGPTIKSGHTAPAPKRHNAESMLRLIAAKDRYGFITRASSTHNPFSDASDARYQLCFRSSMINNCIYSVMLFEHREMIHQAVAMYYESLMDESNRYGLLTIIAHHYSQSNNIDKKIDYIEQLALHNLQIHWMPEAEANLTELLLLAQADPSRALPDRVAKWQTHLAQSLLGQRRYGDSLQVTMQMLRNAGIEWPTNSLVLWLRVQKAWYAQRRAWATVDRSRVPSFATDMAPSKQEIVRLLLNIHNLCALLGLDLDAQLSLLQALRISQKAAREDPNCRALELPELLSKVAFYITLKGDSRLAWEYMDYAVKHLASVPVAQEIVVNRLTGDASHVDGSWDEAIESYVRAESAARFAGIHTEQDRTVQGLSQLYYMAGNYVKSAEVALVRYQQCVDHLDISASVLHGVTIMLCLGASENDPLLREWTEKISALAEKTSMEESSPNVITLYSCAMAFAYFRFGGTDDALHMLQFAADTMSTVRCGLLSLSITFANWIVSWCVAMLVEDALQANDTDLLSQCRQLIALSKRTCRTHWPCFLSKITFDLISGSECLLGRNKRPARAVSIWQNAIAKIENEDEYRGVLAVLYERIHRNCEDEAVAEAAGQRAVDMQCAFSPVDTLG